jgi:hypothetical protein
VTRLVVWVLFPVFLPLPAMVVVTATAATLRAALRRDERRDRPTGLPLLRPAGWLVLGVTVLALLGFLLATGGAGVVPLLWLSMPLAWLWAVLLEAGRAGRPDGVDRTA